LYNVDMNNKTTVKLTHIKCQKCGHEWLPRQAVIRGCPNRKCQTRLWNEPRAIPEAPKGVVPVIEQVVVKPVEVVQ
jgi:hypothetical protein